MRYRIGVSGWSWPSWEGRAWPSGTRPRDRLRHVAARVDAVEATAAAEAVPTVRQLARWRAAVGPEVGLALPVWADLAYRRRLVGPRPVLERVVAAALALGASRGPLLLRLPPTLRCDPTLLADLLVEFDAVRAGVAVPLAVEFSRADWLRGQVFRLLDRHGAAACVTDHPGCLVLEPNDAPFVYVRRYGPDARARQRYPADLLARDAQDVRAWVAAGRDTWVFFRNATDGSALADAAALRSELALHAAPAQR